jgi:hypothetical protein
MQDLVYLLIAVRRQEGREPRTRSHAEANGRFLRQSIRSTARFFTSARTHASSRTRPLAGKHITLATEDVSRHPKRSGRPWKSSLKPKSSLLCKDAVLFVVTLFLFFQLAPQLCRLCDQTLFLNGSGVGSTRRGRRTCRKPDFQGKIPTWLYTAQQMKDNFSLMVLPLLLHLLPLIATVSSWQLKRRARPGLSKFRRVLFRAGLLLSPLGLLLTASCWIDAYPLVQAPDGSTSIPGLELAWTAALLTSIICVILALSGKGWPRILLAVSCALPLALGYGTLLQNGV